MLEFIRSRYRRYRTPTDRGLTLVEALVAIITIAAVTTAITPPIFIAVATRVQNRKAEQAMQLAQGEIDRVRVLLDEGLREEEAEELPELAGDDLSAVGPPDSAADLLSDINSPTTALRIDVDADGSPDFLVQSFRGKQASVFAGGRQVPVVFDLGVRVYSIVAETESNFSGLETTEASLKFTTGQGDTRERPLAVLYTQLGQSDSALSLDKYRCHLDESTSTADCTDEEPEP